MTGDVLEMLVRLMVALPVVLLLAYFALKFGMSRRHFSVKGTGCLKLVEQLPLGPKTFLSMVKVGEKYFLIAHHDGGVKLIKELDNLPQKPAHVRAKDFSWPQKFKGVLEQKLSMPQNREDITQGDKTGRTERNGGDGRENAGRENIARDGRDFEK